MSTHNIGFYEDLTKIIFQLSSNFIKYTISSSETAFHALGDCSMRHCTNTIYLYRVLSASEVQRDFQCKTVVSQDSTVLYSTTCISYDSVQYCCKS